jgi:hypothetical protein
MNKIIIILSVIFLSQNVKAQIVYEEKTFPRVRVIKTKQFGGSGGNGYWNYKYLDKKGLVILEEKYKKKELLAVYSKRYDQNGNLIFESTVYDINHPNGEDDYRTSEISYKYDDTGRPIEKITKIGSSNYVEKIKRQIDSSTFEVMKINSSSYSNNTSIDTTLTVIKLNDKGQVMRSETNQLGSTGTNTTDYIYYDHGKLKRRIIHRNPKPEMEIVYTGWPGSDDMSWEYEYDKKGRIKKLYSIVNGRKTKLEEYSYEEW